MKDKKLTYEDLKLGEKAKDAFLKGESSEYIENNCPVYLNTNDVYGGLNVSDLAIAGVLGGLNSLYVGDTGTGKSQLAQDIFNYYFNGNKMLNGGKAVKIRGRPELDIYEEVYRDLDLKEGRWKPNENIHGMYHFIDELNRCPEITQNQFFGLGDGFLEHKGMKVKLGEKGYSVAVATANLGNGEFGGTFETDKALYNRFAVVFDFDYSQFQPTREDRILIDFLRSANPKIKEAPLRDISDKILIAEREISENSRNLGTEANAVVNYLKFGLENCFNEAIGSKEKNWPRQCQDCEKNPEGKTLCSLVRNPLPRTLSSIAKYSAAMDYLIKLKNPNSKHNSVDLVFKAFELTGAYQKIINPGVLRQEYSEQNPKLMEEVTERLKDDFRKNQDFIVNSIQKAKEGKKFDDYFEFEGKTHFGYSELNEESRNRVKKTHIFNDDGEVGLSWVKDVAKTMKFLNSKTKSKNKK